MSTFEKKSHKFNKSKVAINLNVFGNNTIQI